MNIKEKIQKEQEQQAPYEVELVDNVPGQVIEPKAIPEVEIPEDFNI